MIEKKLNVYLHEQLAGVLSQNESGALSYIYNKDFIHESAHALSLSLPLPAYAFNHDKTKAFFRGCFQMRTYVND